MYIIGSGLPPETSALKAPNKHQQKTEATRRKLLRAARQIFAREGFEAARIESVAAEAGYTRGAFYAHFASKEDLFFALLEEQSTLHLESLRAQLAGCANDQERLEFLRSSYISRASDRQWSILQLEFKLYALRHPKLRAKLAKAHREVRTKLKMETLAAALPPGWFCNDKRSGAASSILSGALQGVALEYAYDPTDLSEEDIALALGRIFDVVIPELTGL